MSSGDDSVLGDRGLLWCPRCGALGRVVYRDSDAEAASWLVPTR